MSTKKFANKNAKQNQCKQNGDVEHWLTMIAYKTPYEYVRVLSYEVQLFVLHLPSSQVSSTNAELFSTVVAPIVDCSVSLALSSSSSVPIFLSKKIENVIKHVTVSYTHLTLPTNREV